MSNEHVSATITFPREHASILVVRSDEAGTATDGRLGFAFSMPAGPVLVGTRCVRQTGELVTTTTKDALCRHCGEAIETCNTVVGGWIHSSSREEHCVDAQGRWQAAEPDRLGIK
jgi:hypothetical protein